MSFTEKQIQEVWEKGIEVINYDSTEYRKDQCDAWIIRSKYGNRDSIYGWEIDHITTKSNDGGDELSNLRPLQWQNNVAKSDGNLVCLIISHENTNIKKK